MCRKMLSSGNMDEPNSFGKVECVTHLFLKHVYENFSGVRRVLARNNSEEVDNVWPWFCTAIDCLLNSWQRIGGRVLL